MRNAARQLRHTLPWRLRNSKRTDTCVHHAIRHCVANLCRKAGLNSEEEVVIPESHEKAHDGTVKEARMDVVVWRRGGLERWMIDTRARKVQQQLL